MGKKRKKKKIKICNILKLVFVLACLILSIVCFEYVCDLDILPSKYLLLFAGIMLLLNIIGSLLLFARGIISKIFSFLIYIIILVVSILGIKYASNTIEFLKKGFNNNIEFIPYNVIVSVDSEYSKLKELNGSKMGYLFLDMDDLEYLDVIKKKVDVELVELGVGELYDELLSGEIDSIIVNEGFVSLFEEEYEDFNTKTKILDTVSIEREKKVTEEKINELKPINIYLSGSDSRSGKIPTTTTSDVNMILTINPETHSLLLTSIPRDYYVQLHGTTGNRDKLTHAGFYGIDMSVNTIEDFMNIEIDYYVKVGFQSVIKLVDLVGGIDVYSDTAFYSWCGDGGAERVWVKEGMNHFTGAQALSYARERYAYSTGDVHRTQNQQQVIEAVLNKMVTNKSLLLKYDTLLNSFSELYITDIPKELITMIIKEQINNMTGWTIEKQNVSGYGSMDYTYSWPGQVLWVMEPYWNTVNDAKAKIDLVLNPDVVEEENIENLDTNE